MEKTQKSLEWSISQALIEYPEALAAMEKRVHAIIEGRESELAWLLEHPPLYTSGTSARTDDLLDKTRFPIFDAGRGGQFTYHGPGQRIAYLMLNLQARNMPDLRRYVQMLESWIIASLAQLGVEAFTREGRIGVWVKDSGFRIQDSKKDSLNPESRILAPEAKIAALGIRVRKWVTFHGVSINVNPDLSHYGGIVPCGINEYGVTSLHKLGITISMGELDDILQREFTRLFA